MIPSFKPGIVASNSIRKVAAGDVTPNAISPNLCNAQSNCTYIEDYYDFFNNRQITGIDTTITVRVEYSNTLTQLYYRKNYSTTVDQSGVNLCEDTQSVRALSPGYNYAANGWTQINNNGTFTLVNNDWISFGCSRKSGSGYTTESVTLKNQSNGDAVLTTFDAEICS